MGPAGGNRGGSAAKLQHPRAAECLAVLVEGERVFLAAERVPGRSLEEALRVLGTATMDIILNVLSQAADALDSAHEAGVLHGGLVPANVRLRPDRTVKLTDFTLAMAARGILAPVAWPASGGLSYLAPEGELGENSPAADIYSLGVLLYEMAAGMPPFSGADRLERKRAGLFASVARPDIPSGFDAILRKALAPLPKDRFATATELYAAVLELAEDRAGG